MNHFARVTGLLLRTLAHRAVLQIEVLHTASASRTTLLCLFINKFDLSTQLAMWWFNEQSKHDYNWPNFSLPGKVTSRLLLLPMIWSKASQIVTRRGQCRL